jgi:hypothetical protein
VHPRFAQYKLVLAIALTPISLLAGEKVDFNRDVLPILSTKCFQCHGPDEGARKAKLRLDVRDNAVAAHDGGRPIVPGKPDQSELIARLTTADEDDRMPPAKKGDRLSEEQIQYLRDWIGQGARYETHWAFVPPRKASLPKVEDPAWMRSPIDRFVLHKLEAEKLEPAGEAPAETLIRRASLDLLGLPPTPAEIDAFVADKSPRAYEHLIDRLLASPHYGERWGRHWLDVARYADSGGFETDLFFGHAWRYRDYVIRAFNADKPFNQFIREQIAGDELFPGNQDARIATGLYTTGPVLQEAGMVAGKLEYDQLTDAADTTGSAFLGMTVGCARCHDHKYDPISQKEYYQLQAVFAASDQFDFKEDGTKLRARAALKKTQDEFELEQARTRAKHEADPAVRAENLRKVGDYYIKLDTNLTRRVAMTRRYEALKGAVDNYHAALAGEASITNAAQLAANSADDDADMNANGDMAMPLQLAGLSTGNKADDALIEVGRRALEMAGRGNESRRAFRGLKTDEEKRKFLLDYGRTNLELPKPDELVTNMDALQLEQGRLHLADESEIPVRILAHVDKPLTVRILKRGELEMPGDAVEPGFPTRFGAPAMKADFSPAHRRASLATWIASDNNPLTARVIVNRVWQWHFGDGLVRTPNDFGIRGERPTHPELLDWLAVDFMQHGWSIKRLHKMIMLSSTYRMSPIADGSVVARDPENRLLTRYQPHRLEAEEIWDGVRAVAGTLNLEMYGLSFAPPLDDQELIGNFRKWPTSTPDESNRRAVYILIKRSFRFPMLSAFDLPDNVTSCGRRDITTIPNQALTLLNNRTIQEQSDAFADRLLRESKGEPNALAALAWKYVYGRAITAGEREQVLGFLRSATQTASLNGAARLKPAVAELCLALFNTNEFIYVE